MGVMILLKWDRFRLLSTLTIIPLSLSCIKPGTQDGVIFGIGDGTTSAARGAHIRINNGTGAIVGFHRGSTGSTAAPSLSNTAINDGNTHVITFRRLNATDWDLWMDDQFLDDHIGLTVGTITDTRLGFGSLLRTGNSVFFDGTVVWGRLL